MIFEKLIDNRCYWFKYFLLRFLLISDTFFAVKCSSESDIYNLLLCGIGIMIWGLLIIKEEIRIK